MATRRHGKSGELTTEYLPVQSRAQGSRCITSSIQDTTPALSCARSHRSSTHGIYAYSPPAASTPFRVRREASGWLCSARRCHPRGHVVHEWQSFAGTNNNERIVLRSRRSLQSVKDSSRVRGARGTIKSSMPEKSTTPCLPLRQYTEASSATSVCFVDLRQSC